MLINTIITTFLIRRGLPTAEPNVLKKEEINDGKLLKLSAPDVEGVVQFLVKERNFNEERIRKVGRVHHRLRRAGNAPAGATLACVRPHASLTLAA